MFIYGADQYITIKGLEDSSPTKSALATLVDHLRTQI